MTGIVDAEGCWRAGILDRWIELLMEAHVSGLQGLRGIDVAWATEAYRTFIVEMARQAEPYLSAFLRDNSDKSAEELEEFAKRLSPGGAHTGGLLVNLVRAELFGADPFLVAAVIRHNWHGGKLGFQFLPNPAELDLYDYEDEAWDLLRLFDKALKGDPRRVLTGGDRAFYDSLPDRFTIYRGCAGVSIEHAAGGVCWTIRRDIAEWFAIRSAEFMKAEPILVSARIAKSEVRIEHAGSSWDRDDLEL